MVFRKKKVISKSKEKENVGITTYKVKYTSVGNYKGKNAFDYQFQF